MADPACAPDWPKPLISALRNVAPQRDRAHADRILSCRRRELRSDEQRAHAPAVEGSLRRRRRRRFWATVRQATALARAEVRDAGVVIEPDVLAVGDERRAVAGGLAVRSLMFAVGFAAVLWLLKEVPFLYAAEPWKDDPYDAFVSFAIAAIRLVGAAALVHLASCRRSEPLPVRAYGS